MAIVERITDNRTVGLPFPASQVITIGDLLYWDAVNLVAKPANLRTDLGSTIANQRDFQQNFLGVAADQRLSTETSTGHDSMRLVTLDGIFDCTCPSLSWEVGNLVGIDRNTATPANFTQQVNKVANPALAIGTCVKRTEGVAVTTVRVRLLSSTPLLSLLAFGAFNSLGGQQGNGRTVLADGNFVMDASTNPYLSMVPTAARNINLPPLTGTAGMEFWFTNNSAGANTVTFLTSSGAAINGNGAVPQNKTGIFWSDGTNWNGMVSA